MWKRVVSRRKEFPIIVWPKRVEIGMKGPASDQNLEMINLYVKITLNGCAKTCVIRKWMWLTYGMGILIAEQKRERHTHIENSCFLWLDNPRHTWCGNAIRERIPRFPGKRRQIVTSWDETPPVVLSKSCGVAKCGKCWRIINTLGEETISGRKFRSFCLKPRNSLPT